MNRPESSIDRVAKARAWFESTADTRLTWHDVEVVVRLRVTSVTTAQQLLLSNDAVIGHWDELMSALGAALESATTAGASSGTAVRDSSHAAGSPAVDQPAGVVGARYAALRAWREEQGGPASGIGDDELLLLAQAPPRNAREYKKRTELVRDHSTELTAVLEGVVGSPSTARAPSSNTTSTRVTPARPTPVPPPRATPTPSAPAPKTTTAPQMPTTMPEPAVPGPELVARPRANRPTGTTGLVDFAHYTYPEAGTSAPTPGAVAFDATGGESVDLSWPAVPDDGRVHIFSVVTKSEYLPAASPTLGDVVASTFDTSAIDTTPFRGPVRYVAIWRSSGPNEHAARAAQPALWAVGETVLPVRNCTVREDEGTVIGNWEPIPGAEHFDVYRVPLGSGLGARREVDVNHQLPGTVVTSGGFTDRDAVPGTAYEYRVYAVAMLGGANRSSPAVTRTVTLEAVAEQVLDLQVTPSEGSETSFDLTWTQPTLGQVEIYRTAEPPMSGIDDRDLDRSAIEGQGGLTLDRRVERAREYQGNRVFLRDVPWPTGWSRAYFTPATVVNENLIRVGPSQSLTRAGAPSAVRLVERVDSQFLTFAWPLGSPTVRVYQGPKGSTHVDPQGEHAIFDISEEDYRKYGGAHLKHPLPAEGCSVHVVGVSYSRGQARYSKPVTVQYDGLARIWYRFETPAPQGRGRRTALPPSRRVVVHSELPFDVDLVLVHNERRLPLHLRDGVETQRRPMSVGPQPQVCFDPVDTHGRTGFVRVFADVPQSKAHLIAVLDPPLHDLRLVAP